jgi:hypothetical protein
MSDIPSNVKVISMREVIQRYDAEGGPHRHWFDEGTMRFFKTKLSSDAYEGPGGVYFVTRETNWSNVTKCSVRQLVGPGDIETRGDFHAYTVGKARRMALTLASMAREEVAAQDKVS